MTEIENPTPTVGTAEYDEAMVRKYAESNPESLPEQFKGDPNAYVDAWKATRAELTRAQQELASLRKVTETAPPEAAPPVPVETGAPSAPEVDSLEIPEPVEFDWSQAEAEVLANGNLSEATRQVLVDKYKIPASVIDGYVQSFTMAAQQAAQKAAEWVGGNEALREILDWSSKTLTEAERNIINTQLRTGDSGQQQTILLGLQARMQRMNPKAGEPANIAAVNAGGKPAVSPYDNPNEMMKDLADPRYRTQSDPEFVKLVQDRIRVTNDVRYR